MARSKKQITFVDPSECSILSGGCPDKVIELIPHIKRLVGISIGYIDEGEADADDIYKYPIVRRPWINESEMQ